MPEHFEVQRSIKELAGGNFDVLHDTYIAHMMPSAMLLLLENNKFQDFDNLLIQVSGASSALDRKIRLAASNCFIETAKFLSITKYKNREFLEKMIPDLKRIAGSPVYPDQDRSVARSILEKIYSMQTVATSPSPDEPSVAKDTLAIKEENIFQLAKAGNTDEAKQLLFDLVISCAKNKDFANAERLREQIYDIDPLALMEIIQCGEIIEKEKSGNLCEDSLETWAKLRQDLRDYEFNNLIHAMEQRTVEPEETFVDQGTINDELYFIDCGSVRVSSMSGDKELFLKNLSPGTMIGENFFQASVWTVSLTALKHSKILVLHPYKLSELEQKSPGIESKLRDYYHRTSDINKMLRLKSIDRRIHERFKHDCRIELQLLDDSENILSSFKGEMDNISQWGLSFIVRIAKKGNSRLLLGRKIQISIPCKITQDKIILRGKVIGIQPYNLVASDFSVHVEFTQELDRRTIQAILGEYHAIIK